MRISTIIYEFKQGFKNIGRNWMFSLASIITMAACIFLFGIFFSIVTNVNHIVKNVEENVGITVFFEEGTKDKVMKQVGEEISERPEVAKINFVSAEEAWEEYKKLYFEDAEEAAEGFKDDNPLANAAHYEVYVNKIENQNELVDYILGLESVRKVNQSESAVKTLTGFNKLVGYVSIAIIAILLIVAIFLISNTVSVGISIRKEEIGIMKLIGATNFFVRMPFLLEGIILGLIGAAIPLGILYFGYSQVVVYILTRFKILTDVMQFIPVEEVFRVLLPVGLALGMGIGFLGSLFTTKKHLKV
ncbi:MAG: permease-like cell division protein FtsX [Eubacteriales bacterium]|nr:permease-like cell division protein FtsX [Eubacteriales bacterium]